MSRSDSRFRIRIRNWEKHQRDMRGEGKRRRRRDWIALSTDVCRDPDVLALTVEQRWLWIALLAHAGRVGPEFDISGSTARVMFGLRPGWRAMTDLPALENHGFIALDVLIEGKKPAAKKTTPAPEKKTPKPKEEKIPYPPGLNIKAWEQYMQYRRDCGYRKYKPKYAMQAMKKWAQHAPESQQKAVDATIEKGWQGVFPEKYSDRNSLSAEQLEEKQRADTRSLALLLNIEQRNDETWDSFAARVTAANERRLKRLS